MKSLQRSAAVIVTLVAALSGCGGGDSDDDKSTDAPDTTATSTLTAAPAGGDTITTDDFTYTVPEGWKESKSPAMSLAIDLEDHDGFSDNINVIRDDTLVGLDKGEVEDAIKKVLAGIDAESITMRGRIPVDGEDATHVESINEVNDQKYRTEQYVVRHRDGGYVITLSFSHDVPTAERDAVSESILATWKWAS